MAERMSRLENGALIRILDICKNEDGNKGKRVNVVVEVEKSRNTWLNTDKIKNKEGNIRT